MQVATKGNTITHQKYIHGECRQTEGISWGVQIKLGIIYVMCLCNLCNH